MKLNLPRGIALAIAAALFLFLQPIIHLVTDWMWFKSQGFEHVFWATTGAQWGIGLAMGLLAGGAVYVNARVALGDDPDAGPRLATDLRDNPLGEALSNVAPSTLAVGVAVLTGLLFGTDSSTWWVDGMEAWHGADFDFIDPIFGMDASFYVFFLPLLLHMRVSLQFLLGLCLLVSAAAYLSRGAVKIRMHEVDGQLVPEGLSIRPEARRHLAGLVAASLIMLSMGLVLQRFELLYDESGLFTGPGYTDTHATLILLTVQAVAAAIAALAGWMAIERTSQGWALVTMSLLFAPGGLSLFLPGVLQAYSVKPNELAREGPHIVDHIEATRFAFGIDEVDERPLSGDNSITLEDLANNELTIKNIRLWDHAPLLTTFQQVQEIRTYYDFSNVDNDRYLLDGELRQIMLSPRELPASSLAKEAQTWVNQRMTYTHGYGITLGPVNEVNEQGLPKLFVQDLPPKSTYPELEIDRPEIYFGEHMPTEVFVETDNPEFDFPAGDDNRFTTYTGTGGVRMGTVERLLFAIRMASSELLFSDDLTPDSKVLMYRRVLERVRRIAPFLHVDSDPYMVVAEGRLVWIVDTYTTSDHFPYSTHVDRIGNYLRNPVKVTIDAYDGQVTFYRTTTADPIADAWASALPGLFKPISEMPESLQAHIRYPVTQFAVQSQLFATYHMSDQQVFYNREDLWEVPTLAGSHMAPYYTVMKLPGEDREEFILMLPFSPSEKPNLAAWMVVRSDGEGYGEMRAYKFPKEKMVYGPTMIDARINQDADISAKISLWDQQGSSVQRGTLLVIPVEESLLYVQPLYLVSEGLGSIPELKRVIVAYDDNIAMAPTLEASIAKLFGAAIPAGREVTQPSSNPMTPAEAVDWQGLSRSAAALFQGAKDAAGTGDWTTWGQQLTELEQTLNALQALAPAEAGVEAGVEDAPEAVEDAPKVVEEAPE